MFELSFGKLLILVAVIAVVWLGARRSSRPAHRQSEEPPPSQGNARRVEAEDMTPCPVCGTYVTANRPAACDRPDCPYR